MNAIPTSLLRAYDIRGIYDRDLTEAAAIGLGQRFGARAAQANPGATIRVVMARDGRTHSPQLAQAFSQGLRDVGCHVVDVGLAPTPVVSFALREKGSGFHAGVMVTGSHNPPEHNGFKLTLGLHPFFGDDIQRLGTMPAPHVTPVEGSHKTDASIVDRYVQHLLHQCPRLPHGMSLTWDCGHGATGPVVRALSDAWAARGASSVRILYEQVDGTFPAHPPDPSHVANMASLMVAVTGDGAIGLALDGDGDRLGVVLPELGLLPAEHILWHMARTRIQQSIGRVVLMDVKMSAQLPPLIESVGGTSVIWKTGHAHIKKKMFDLHDVVVAGEASGHFFFPELGYDDGLYAAVQVLASYAQLEESLALYPPSCITPELRLLCEDPHKAIQQLKSILDMRKTHYSDLDGVRIESADGWWLARASHTESVITVRIESFTNDYTHLVLAVHKLLTHILKPEDLEDLLNIAQKTS